MNPRPACKTELSASDETCPKSGAVIKKKYLSVNGVFVAIICCLLLGYAVISGLKN